MWSLLIFFMAVACAALTGAQFSPGEWYASLTKPPWTPPNWLFAPAWTLLYMGIAVAGWRVWCAEAPAARVALVLWIVQLLLNMVWSWLFFGLHRTGLGLIDIVLLLVAIIAFMIAAGPVDRLATGLFVPYALWVGYASTLNFYIWRFNSAP